MHLEERFFATLAYLIPSRLKYWCFAAVVSEATTGKYSQTVVPELTCMEALKRFAEDHRI